MMEIAGSYYDGQTSERREARIIFDHGHVRIEGIKKNLVYPLTDVRISSRVANTPRSIYLPGGAKCETLDNDAVDAALNLQGRGPWQALLYTLESKARWVLLAIVLAVTAAWGFIEFGIPALAKRAAFALPQSVNTALGRDGLKAMDKVLLSPTELGKERQRRLRSLFDEVVEGVPEVPGLQLELRKSARLGPNALALPSGIIVVTDDLVLLAKNQNELISILAHEIGHVKQHHALRTLLQNSTAVLVVASVTGDLTSISALAAAMPTLLLEAKYSRAFETEADLFAREYMIEHDIPLHHFADILTRIEEETKDHPGTHYYLSSHPATRQRIEMFTDED